MNGHTKEVKQGKRFEFGKNWSYFLLMLNDQKIAQAAGSLKTILRVEGLTGKSFLDIGSGSGLFSLAARYLGARVHSFDYDPQSVACTKELRRRYYPEDTDWTIEEGSVLDSGYITSLGTFDIVYSWGVLHHTGEMWTALQNAQIPVVRGGKLAVAIYNDQGRTSRYWTWIKKTYNFLPVALRFLVFWPAALRLWGPTMVRDLMAGKPFYSWRNYDKLRGMSPWSDLVDWVGGYPFEVAKPEEIFDFYRQRGFGLLRMKTCGGGLGCNEFLFQRTEN